MKKVTLRKQADKEDRDGIRKILVQVMSNSPNRALPVDEMRKRVHVIDAIEAMGEDDHFHLEDSDYQVLKDGLLNFPWSQANRTLVGMIDDVEAAETVSFLKVVKGEAPGEAKEA